MNLRKLFTRKRQPEVEAPLFNRWTLKALALAGVEPVDAGYPRPGDYVWIMWNAGVYLAAYHGGSNDKQKALVGALCPVKDEDGNPTFISTPAVVSMDDVARTGYHRVDIQYAHHNGERWEFVLTGDEDTRPMEPVR